MIGQISQEGVVPLEAYPSIKNDGNNHEKDYNVASKDATVAFGDYIDSSKVVTFLKPLDNAGYGQLVKIQQLTCPECDAKVKRQRCFEQVVLRCVDCNASRMAKEFDELFRENWDTLIIKDPSLKKYQRPTQPVRKEKNLKRKRIIGDVPNIYLEDEKTPKDLIPMAKLVIPESTQDNNNQNDPLVRYLLEKLQRAEAEIESLKSQITNKDMKSAPPSSNQFISYAKAAMSKPMASPMKNLINDGKKNVKQVFTKHNENRTSELSLPLESTKNTPPKPKKRISVDPEAADRYFRGEPVRRNMLSFIYIKGLEVISPSEIRRYLEAKTRQHAIRNVCWLPGGILQVLMFDEEVSSLRASLEGKSAAIFVGDEALREKILRCVKITASNAERITNGLYVTRKHLRDEAARLGRLATVPVKTMAVDAPNVVSQSSDSIIKIILNDQ